MGVGFMHHMDPQGIQPVPQPLQLGMGDRGGFHKGGNAHLIVSGPHLLDFRLGKLQRKLTGAGTVKLVEYQRFGAVAGDKLRRDTVKALSAVPLYDGNNILHHLQDPHIDTGTVEKEVLRQEDIADGQQRNILRRIQPPVAQVIHHVHRRHHLGGDNAGDAPALQSAQHLFQVFQRQRTEQVGLDLHQILIREYHIVLLVKQLAGFQHQTVGVGVFPGGNDQNIAVPQRNHVPQRRYHGGAVIKIDMVALGVNFGVMVKEDDRRFHRFVMAVRCHAYRIIQDNIVQPVPLLVGFQLLHCQLGLYQDGNHLNIPRPDRLVGKFLPGLDMAAAVQRVDQVLRKAAPVIAQQKAHDDLAGILWMIPQLLHRPFHPLAQILADKAGTVDHMRHRCHRSPRPLGDLLYRCHL